MSISFHTLRMYAANGCRLVEPFWNWTLLPQMYSGLAIRLVPQPYGFVQKEGQGGSPAVRKRESKGENLKTNPAGRYDSALLATSWAWVGVREG